MNTQIIALLIIFAAACGQATTTPPKRNVGGNAESAARTISGWDGLSHRGNTTFDVTPTP